MRAALRSAKRLRLPEPAPTCPAPGRALPSVRLRPVLGRPSRLLPPRSSNAFRTLHHHNVTEQRPPEPVYDEPTIYALSTAPGKAAIAVIRVSGSACKEIYHGLCPDKPLPKPRFAALRTLYTPSAPPTRENILDAGALVLYFPSPRTVTGEDILELHVHGGPAIVKAVLAAIPQCGAGTPGRIRYAEAGEFTRRAFLHDRMDLTQIEALGDTLSAQTEQQRKLSVRGVTSALGKRFEDWRKELVEARGELEALIDFSEDQHFDESPAELASSVAQKVSVLMAQIEAHERNAMKGELLRNGMAVSLLGEPNAGKSSLLNRIVGREAAIVSTEAGTTRDVVEVGVDLDGWFCRLGDTAGLRSNPDAASASDASASSLGAIEKRGIELAKERALESHVLIVLLPLAPTEDRKQFGVSISPDVANTVARCLEREVQVVVAINKSDLLPDDFDARALKAIEDRVVAQWPQLDREQLFFISCKRAEDADRPAGRQATRGDPGRVQHLLRAGVIRAFERLTAPTVPEGVAGAEAPDPSFFAESLGASERQRLLLADCLGHLDAFVGQVYRPREGHLDGTFDEEAVVEDAEVDIVMAAEELRRAAECLARITGRGEGGDVEEVLGVVFEKFCVGK